MLFVALHSRVLLAHYKLSCVVWHPSGRDPLEQYTVRTGFEMPAASEEDESDYVEPGVELESRTCSCRKNCAFSVHLILSQYNLLTDAYHVTGLAYTFLLTLSITCEWSFSTLKFVKKRLRNSLT